MHLRWCAFTPFEKPLRAFFGSLKICCYITARYLKITEKGSFNIARATFTFWVIKSWLKMPKMVYFGEFLKTWSLRSNSVTRQVSLKKTKIGEKCQNWKIQMRHFGWFSNTVCEVYLNFDHIDCKKTLKIIFREQTQMCKHLKSAVICDHLHLFYSLESLF